jgi:chromosome segregation ATPase
MNDINNGITNLKSDNNTNKEDIDELHKYKNDNKNRIKEAKQKIEQLQNNEDEMKNIISEHNRILKALRLMERSTRGERTYSRKDNMPGKKDNTTRR